MNTLFDINCLCPLFSSVICYSRLIASCHRTSPNKDICPGHHSQTNCCSDLLRTMLPVTMPHSIYVIQCRASRLTSALPALSLSNPTPRLSTCQQYPVIRRPDDTRYSSIGRSPYKAAVFTLCTSASGATFLVSSLAAACAFA